MAVWGVRAGRRGDSENFAIDNNCIVHGSDLPDLSRIDNRAVVLDLFKRLHPNEGEGTLKSWAAQLWAFAKRIQVGDLVVLPRKVTSTIAIGRVAGEYKYADAAPPGAKHQRPVEWIATDLPRQRLDQDILHSLGSAMTVFQVSRNNAEERIRGIVHMNGAPAQRADAGSSGARTDGEPEVSLEATDSVDVERLAQDEILQRIGAKFHGHEMERLVEAVLSAQGFKTERAPVGADGGVDIVAGKGPLGLEPPRMCVQVKSSNDPADVGVFREMQGVLSSFGGDLGLIISWGGFKRSVRQESRRHFFKIRLWDAGDLIAAVLENYERLPEDIQKDIPLKRIWTLVSDESA